MVTIAMTREMGTLGKDVAQGHAEALGLEVIHSELVEHDIAARLGVSDSAVHRYLEGDASVFERWKIGKKKLSQYTAEEILELARGGNVLIRGWGAVAVLRHVPCILRVRVCAPMPFRERVMMERLGLKDPGRARQEIEHNDAAHAHIMRGFFGVNWENALLYHVVLNTGSLSVDTCVRTLRLLAEDEDYQENETTRTILADQLVRSRVRAALGSLASGGAAERELEFSVTEGMVVLSGAISAGVDLRGALARIRKIEGVKDVENHVRRIMRPSSV